MRSYTIESKYSIGLGQTLWEGGPWKEANLAAAKEVRKHIVLGGYVFYAVGDGVEFNQQSPLTDQLHQLWDGRV